MERLALYLAEGAPEDKSRAENVVLVRVKE